jgi:alpha-tubulin suppressor-like RCC1 family protein
VFFFKLSATNWHEPYNESPTYSTFYLNNLLLTMPKPIDEDRVRRKAELERKKEARKAAKEKLNVQSLPETRESSDVVTHPKVPSLLHALPEDAMQVMYSLLPAADLGRLILTCKSLRRMLPAARIPFLCARLGRPHAAAKGRVGYTDLCADESEARQILEQSSIAGGDGLPQHPDEFISYARFLEEAVGGYGCLSTGGNRTRTNPIHLPAFVQGRFVSVSPEHSLCRVGGDGQKSGAGGSGIASWGVGKRGQLGHGKREDEKLPRTLLGGLGYGIRIVQCSAGGGLVRIAHSLLLTSTGRVLSFGAGANAALGHGYFAANQLPDCLRPRYIEALSGVRCICVAAGELHSAAVSSDGDVYTWGDGFCGQLGHGDKRPQLTPKQIEIGGLEDEMVTSIVCGGRHSIACTEDGEVWTWGLGHFGVLGRSYSPFDYDADATVAAFADIEVDRLDDLVVDENDGVAERNARDEQARLRADPAARDHAAELLAHLDLIANVSLDDSSDQCLPRVVDSLRNITIVGASAGHRHSLFLDIHGSLYSCGAGSAGCLGHGDTSSNMYPIKISTFDEDGTRVIQMDAGVDISMAVTSKGDVYSWGKSDGGRIGLGLERKEVMYPRKVSVTNAKGKPVKAVDVACGYFHSLIVGLDGTVHQCGGVGTDGLEDGQEVLDSMESTVGKSREIADFNIWPRRPEPKEEVKKERWKKLGKYEVKGRSKMLRD